MPTDAELEQSLRNAVRAHLQNPSDIDASVNSLREHVEKELKLDEGFFRRDEWKTKSKAIIQDEFDKDADAEESNTKPSNNGTKRASASSSSRPRKKSKMTTAEEEDEGETTPLSDLPTSSEDEMDFDEPKKKTAGQRGAKNASQAKDPKREEEGDGPILKSDKSTKNESKAKQEPLKTNKTSTLGIPEVERDDDSSSELSSVKDDLPPPTKTKKASSKNAASKSSKPSASKSKTKATTEVSPEGEEIRRLQGWLVKCGIRKVWGKELKPYETPKAKIAHLKSMLANAGMTGRYSNDKAAQIKEARELAADIEAVQEGNERWGLGSEPDDDDDDDGGGRRRSDPKGADTSVGTGRRLVRGAKNYDFLSSDGEETD